MGIKYLERNIYYYLKLKIANSEKNIKIYVLSNIYDLRNLMRDLKLIN